MPSSRQSSKTKMAIRKTTKTKKDDLTMKGGLPTVVVPVPTKEVDPILEVVRATGCHPLPSTAVHPPEGSTTALRPSCPRPGSRPHGGCLPAALPLGSQAAHRHGWVGLHPTTWADHRLPWASRHASGASTPLRMEKSIITTTGLQRVCGTNPKSFTSGSEGGTFLKGKHCSEDFLVTQTNLSWRFLDVFD